MGPDLDGVILLDTSDLRHLAAKTDQQHRRKIGIVRRAPKGADKKIVQLALGSHATTALMNDRHDPVDVRIVVEQTALLRLFGNELRDGCRTVHAGEHRDVVAGADAPVGALVAHEAARLTVGMEGGNLAGLFAQVGGCEILHMNVRAGGDIRGGDADHLPVFADHLTLCDGTRGNLVTEGNGVQCRDVFACDLRTCGKGIGGDNHIVARVKTDDTGVIYLGFGFGHGILLNSGWREHCRAKYVGWEPRAMTRFSRNWNNLQF